MLIEFLSKINDNRRREGKRYDLPHILLFSIFAALSGADSYRKINQFIDSKFNCLKNSFNLDWKKPPAYTTIRDIIQGLDTNSLEQVFGDYSKELNNKNKSNNYSKKDHYLNKYQLLSVDGKVLRGSFDNFNDKKAKQILSVFNSNNKIILAHKEIDDKTNEIPEFQSLVKELDMEGKIIFTLDAMHTQKNTKNSD
jgi:hypothetical protein